MILGQEFEAFDWQGSVPGLADLVFIAHLPFGRKQTTIDQPKNVFLLHELGCGGDAVHFVRFGLGTLDLLGVAHGARFGGVEHDESWFQGVLTIHDFLDLELE